MLAVWRVELHVSCPTGSEEAQDFHILRFHFFCRLHREMQPSLIKRGRRGSLLIRPTLIFRRLFGRDPLLSEISPNKTWERALGGLVVSMTLP